MSDDLATLLERAARLRAERDQLLEEVGPRRRWLGVLGAAGVAVLGAAVAAVLISRAAPRTILTGELAGAPCTVAVHPAYGFDNAWVQVDCDEQRLYGYESLGYATCEIVGGSVVRCTDSEAIGDDGDPTLHLDVAAGRLTLADGAGWEITIADLR